MFFKILLSFGCSLWDNKGIVILISFHYTIFDFLKSIKSQFVTKLMKYKTENIANYEDYIANSCISGIVSVKHT